VSIVTSFPTPGRYKLWAQFQKAGEVITLPFELQVEQGEHAVTAAKIPGDAVRIRIGPHGYDPPRVEIPSNRPVTLAFTREDAPNCGADVFVPSLGLRSHVPIGETVLIDLPAQPPGELSFTCGMGMFRGMIVVK
jgi:plastocyanin domain-containing protein